jgi:hypothetical protein
LLEPAILYPKDKQMPRFPGAAKPASAHAASIARSTTRSSVMQHGSRGFLRAVTLSLMCATTVPVLAWSTDPQLNTDISTASGNQVAVQMVSDGSGGTIFVWQDQRAAPSNADIYAQRVNSAGVAQWTANGVAICTSAGNQTLPQLLADGSGGALITWQDSRTGTGDIYAQRIDTSGAVQWTVNGVAICTATGDQSYPQMAPDSSTGAIIGWQDNRNGNQDIYAQRIDNAGAVQWAANGVVLCTAAGGQFEPVLARDGLGGAIVAWNDNRTTNDIYAQRVNGSGAVQWAADGVSVCSATGDQYNSRITSDGSGGAIIAWQDYRTGTADIYAQVLNGSGIPVWTADGVPVCTAVGSQTAPRMVGNGLGNAIVVWQDARSFSNDIYAQRLAGSGSGLWTIDGVPVSTTAASQELPQIASDGSSGAIIAWEDNRNGFYDIYAQRINSSGTEQWTTDGIGVATNSENQTDTSIASDGSGGAIIAWRDLRSTTNIDLYASRVSSAGVLLPVSLSRFAVE